VKPEQSALLVDVTLAPFLLPDAAATRRRIICIVVDVIRATTTLCVQFERGCRRVYVAGSIEQARAAARELAHEAAATAQSAPLLAGEVRSVAPPGFDYGNSPAEFGALDLEGREVVFATTNGTRALYACAGSAATLVGSLRNATAVAMSAVALAKQLTAPSLAFDVDPANSGEEVLAAVSGDEQATEARPPSAGTVGATIAIVCAGRGGRPAYDDTLCAGCLVERVERAASERGWPVVLAEGAHIAAAVWAEAAPRDLRAALAESEAARAVVAIGLEPDLDWCAAMDTCDLVPAATAEDPLCGLLVVERLVRADARFGG
jgi:2-phosphosulfolactate phosphatase